MKLFVFIHIIFLSLGSMSLAKQPSIPNKKESVILLHGLCRSYRAMTPMQKFLEEHGYHVVNTGYPSTKAPIEKLAQDYLPAMLEQCLMHGSQRIHIVTHSLGGILIREYLSQKNIPQLGKVVMLAPPNYGSPLIDKFGDFKLLKWIQGEAGEQLCTTANGKPHQLNQQPYKFRYLGIIAGKHSLNPLYSALIPGQDDGKVPVENTKHPSMTDYLVLPTSHSFIMRDKEVKQQCLAFLQTGRFSK